MSTSSQEMDKELSKQIFTSFLDDPNVNAEILKNFEESPQKALYESINSQLLFLKSLKSTVETAQKNESQESFRIRMQNGKEEEVTRDQLAKLIDENHKALLADLKKVTPPQSEAQIAATKALQEILNRDPALKKEQDIANDDPNKGLKEELNQQIKELMKHDALIKQAIDDPSLDKFQVEGNLHPISRVEFAKMLKEGPYGDLLETSKALQEKIEQQKQQQSKKEQTPPKPNTIEAPKTEPEIGALFKEFAAEKNVGKKFTDDMTYDENLTRSMNYIQVDLLRLQKALIASKAHEDPNVKSIVVDSSKKPPVTITREELAKKITGLRDDLLRYTAGAMDNNKDFLKEAAKLTEYVDPNTPRLRALGHMGSTSSTNKEDTSKKQGPTELNQLHQAMMKKQLMIDNTSKMIKQLEEVQKKELEKLKIDPEADKAKLNEIKGKLDKLSETKPTTPEEERKKQQEVLPLLEEKDKLLIKMQKDNETIKKMTAKLSNSNGETGEVNVQEQLTKLRADLAKLEEEKTALHKQIEQSGGKDRKPGTKSEATDSSVNFLRDQAAKDLIAKVAKEHDAKCDFKDDKCFIAPKGSKHNIEISGNRVYTDSREDKDLKIQAQLFADLMKKEGKDLYDTKNFQIKGPDEAKLKKYFEEYRNEKYPKQNVLELNQSQSEKQTLKTQDKPPDPPHVSVGYKA